MVYEIAVFSNPLNGIVGKDGLLAFKNYAETARYDEELVKPALFLADRVVLHSYRLDLALDERRSVENMKKLIPVYSELATLSRTRDAGVMAFLGLSDSDLLSDAELDRYESQHKADEAAFEIRQKRVRSTNREAFLAERAAERAEIDANSAVWEEFWARSSAYRLARKQHATLAASKFETTSLSHAVSSEVLIEVPWDDTPRSRPREVLDNMQGPNTEFRRAFESMVGEVERSPIGVMFDDEVHASLSQLRGSMDGLESETVVSGAAELMRMVSGLSELPMNEIPDARIEVAEYMDPFRSFVLDVSRSVDLGEKSDAERKRQLALAWESQVAPAIREMESHLRSAGFVRNAIDVFGNSGETMRTVGMAIGIATAAGFAGISTLTAAAAVAPPILKAFIGSVRATEAATQHRAYFVHALGRTRAARRQTKRGRP